MPSSLKLFWLLFVPLLPPLWITFTARMLLPEIAFHHGPFTPQHRLDWTESAWPKATFYQKANAVVGDTDIKEATFISPHDFAPWAVFSRHGPSWVPHCSSIGPIWGWLRTGTGWAELEYGRVLWGCPATPDITQTLRGPPAHWWESPRGTKGLKFAKGLHFFVGRSWGQYRMFIPWQHIPQGSNMGKVHAGCCCFPTFVCKPKGTPGMMGKGGTGAGYLPTWVLKRWSGGFIYYYR